MSLGTTHTKRIAQCQFKMAQDMVGSKQTFEHQTCGSGLPKGGTSAPCCASYQMSIIRWRQATCKSIPDKWGKGEPDSGTEQPGGKPLKASLVVKNWWEHFMFNVQVSCKPIEFDPCVNQGTTQTKGHSQWHRYGGV